MSNLQFWFRFFRRWHFGFSRAFPSSHSRAHQFYYVVSSGCSMATRDSDAIHFHWICPFWIYTYMLFRVYPFRDGLIEFAIVLIANVNDKTYLTRDAATSVGSNAQRFITRSFHRSGNIYLGRHCGLISSSLCLFVMAILQNQRSNERIKALDGCYGDAGAKSHSKSTRLWIFR